MARTRRIKEQYLQRILRGERTLELRGGYPKLLWLKAGDVIRLNDCCLATMHRAARHHNSQELREAQDPRTVTLHLSAGELLSALRSIYPPQKEALGVVALELEPSATTS